MSDIAETNVALTRKAYALWNEGGPAAMVESFFAPDVVLHDMPDIVDTGTYEGADAVVDRGNELIELGGHFQYVVHWVEGHGDYVISSVDQCAEGTTSGAPVSMRVYHVSRVLEGRLREFWAFRDEEQARSQYEQLTG